MRVRLFGLIAERAGSEFIEADARSVEALRALLVERIAGLEALSYAIAVDRVIVRDDAPLSGSEEVALLPPFAGG